MAIWFISDLHLSAEQPQITAHFVQFLQQAQSQAEALYILGDLFDRWIGDDDNAAYIPPIISALKQLTQHIPCYFIAGNRDFLLGSTFCGQTGVTLLQEPAVVTLHGTPVLLMHGDLLCTDDKEYLRYRAKVRQPQTLQSFLSRPLWLRKIIAKLLRLISKTRIRNKNMMILDTNPQAILDTMRAYNVEYLIHGHTHRPATHTKPDGEKQRHIIVLGDWHDNHGWCLKWQTEKDFDLIKLVNGRDERI